MGLSVSPRDISRTDVANGFTPFRQDELALERAYRTEHVVAMMMRRRPLPGRIPIFENPDAVVLEDHPVLLTIGNHGVAGWVAQLIEFGSREVAHRSSFETVVEPAKALRKEDGRRTERSRQSL